MKSGIFTLGVRDFLKGLFMAVLGAIFGVIQESLAAGSLTFDWHKIELFALAAFVTYISKNFLTNNKDQVLKKDVPT